jgi:glycosyltransferase involved in cell wall biosynthesis
MTIGCISPYLHALGGGERYMMTIASYLSRTHSVTIFWDDSTIAHKIEQRFGIDMSHIVIKPNIWKTGSLGNKLIESSKFDCLIFLSDGSIPFSLAKKNILHFQRPFHNVSGTSVINQIKLHRFQKILVNSMFTKPWIDIEYHVDSTILYPPVTPYHFDSKKKQHIILSVGRFSNEERTNKKQLVLLSAFRQLQIYLSQKKLNYTLTLAGGILPEDIAFLEKVKQYAKGLPVSIRTNISQKEMSDLYESAEFYWHATGFGENETLNPEGFEHFGISTVEAMSAGLIPLVFNGGGQREIINHKENGILWNTEDELVKSTIDLIEDKSTYVLLQKNALKRSIDFSEKVFTDSFENIFLNI